MPVDAYTEIKRNVQIWEVEFFLLIEAYFFFSCLDKTLKHLNVYSGTWNTCWSQVLLRLSLCGFMVMTACHIASAFCEQIYEKKRLKNNVDSIYPWKWDTWWRQYIFSKKHLKSSRQNHWNQELVKKPRGQFKPTICSPGL